jgi:chorismate synthase
MGIVVDGFPAGMEIHGDDIQRELDKRRPGQSQVTTSRREEDEIQLLSGVYNDFTTGAPICMLVWNKDRDSSGYLERRWTPRPGHADYTAHIKYGGFNDFRGGGRFSGRITAGYVMAGALARKLIEDALGVEVIAHAKEIGGIRARDPTIEEIRRTREGNPLRCGDPETASLMEEAVKTASREGDSLGGIVECFAINMPQGLGEPVFDTIEGELSKAFFSIPAVKAVGFGFGRALASMRGSEGNDAFTFTDGEVKTETNRMGGILGGISVGTPIRCEVTFKPTPSIIKEQRTVNLRTGEEVTLAIGGRHDPCIVPRAVPVVEGMTAFVIADLALRHGLIPRFLEN